MFGSACVHTNVTSDFVGKSCVYAIDMVGVNYEKKVAVIPTCGILHPTKNLSLLQGAIPLEEAIKMEVLAQQVIILLNE